MLIQEIDENKKRYLHLLLLADEQEDMVDRYLERGTMLDYQKQGYARKLIDFLVAKYSEQYSVLQVGTGDSPLTIPFYEKCGFIRSYVVKNFFIDNYDHPIFECGKQLIDMVYLQKML